MVARGSLDLPDPAGWVFVGNGIAYVSRRLVPGLFPSGGFSTADVSDPDRLTLISGPDLASGQRAPGTQIVANGSGLAVLMGSDAGINALDLMSVSDPANTNNFITRINLPDAPGGVAL